jgi:hypothetical protein
MQGELGGSPFCDGMKPQRGFMGERNLPDGAEGWLDAAGAPAGGDATGNAQRVPLAKMCERAGGAPCSYAHILQFALLKEWARLGLLDFQ